PSVPGKAEIRVAATVVAVLAFVALGVFGLSACSGRHRVVPTAVAAPGPPAAPVVTAPPPPPPPPGPPPAVVADAILTSVGIFPSPGAPPSGTLANPNPLGQPLVFLVREQQGGWLKVALP